MSCFVHVPRSVDRAGDLRTYVGWTTDLAARLAGAGARTTRSRQWILPYATGPAARP